MTGQKGTEFTAKYINKFHELEEGNTINALFNAINALNSISDSITNMKNDFDMRLSKMGEQSQPQQTIEITKVCGKPTPLGWDG